MAAAATRGGRTKTLGDKLQNNEEGGAAAAVASQFPNIPFHFQPLPSHSAACDLSLSFSPNGRRGTELAAQLRVRARGGAGVLAHVYVDTGDHSGAQTANDIPKFWIFVLILRRSLMSTYM